MATILYEWIRAHPDAPVLLLSATVIRNAPHTSHSLLTYIQKAETWPQYRAKQYELISRPYQPRPFYSPVRGWQKYSAKMIRENASVVNLSDIVSVPEQFEEVVYLYKKQYDAPMSRCSLVIYKSHMPTATAVCGFFRLRV